MTLLEAAKNLRAAQRDYMANRGDEEKGRAVAAAATALDAQIERVENGPLRAIPEEWLRHGGVVPVTHQTVSHLLWTSATSGHRRMGPRREHHRSGAHVHRQGLPRLGHRREAARLPLQQQARHAVRDGRAGDRGQGADLRVPRVAPAPHAELQRDERAVHPAAGRELRADHRAHRHRTPRRQQPAGAGHRAPADADKAGYGSTSCATPTSTRRRSTSCGLSLGVPKELARLPVPVARYSRMRASANLRNWLAFLTLRMAPNAQWEIRQYANAVGEIVADASRGRGRCSRRREPNVGK
jgi:hypothetical protein